MAVVYFSLQMFLARYPEFTAVNAANSARLPALFSEAGLYCNNTDASRISPNQRIVLLNMLTAHISFIYGDLSADGQVRPVGRMSQASQGSVSASFEGVAPTVGSGAWFQQSQYGAAFWQATSLRRGFRYVPGRSRI
jgi:hypothetical protein